MAYVQQVCQGYNKKSLMGNWYQERLYPKQPFREDRQKQARSKDEGITCLDGTGFQRGLPRLQRRSKWQTTGRVILDDGIPKAPSVTRAEYPDQEQQSSYQEMRRPYDKNSGSVNGTSRHPTSQVKPVQMNYHIMDIKNSDQTRKGRDVMMYGSDFKSSLPQHPATQKYSNYVSEYKGRFPQQQNPQEIRNRTQSQFMRSSQPAGNYRQVTNQETVKPITTLFCENRKDVGDEKERTGVQRSWVPPRDKALSYGVGKAAHQLKGAVTVQNDVQTSLNMNVGVHSMHPQDVPDGYFRHTRSITVQHNQTPCLRP